MRKSNKSIKRILTCLGGIPESVATATRCTVELLTVLKSLIKISPESTIVNNLKKKVDNLA